MSELFLTVPNIWAPPLLYSTLWCALPLVACATGPYPRISTTTPLPLTHSRASDTSPDSRTTLSSMVPDTPASSLRGVAVLIFLSFPPVPTRTPTILFRLHHEHGECDVQSLRSHLWENGYRPVSVNEATRRRSRRGEQAMLVRQRGTSACTRVYVPPRVTGGVGTDTCTAVGITSREGTVVW